VIVKVGYARYLSSLAWLFMEGGFPVIVLTALLLLILMKTPLHCKKLIKYLIG